MGCGHTVKGILSHFCNRNPLQWSPIVSGNKNHELVLDFEDNKELLPFGQKWTKMDKNGLKWNWLLQKTRNEKFLK